MNIYYLEKPEEIPRYLDNILTENLKDKIKNIEDTNNMPEEIRQELSAELKAQSPNNLMFIGTNEILCPRGGFGFPARDMYDIIKNLP